MVKNRREKTKHMSQKREFEKKIEGTKKEEAKKVSINAQGLRKRNMERIVKIKENAKIKIKKTC